jgi:hypothetical protein
MADQLTWRWAAQQMRPRVKLCHNGLFALLALAMSESHPMSEMDTQLVITVGIEQGCQGYSRRGTATATAAVPIIASRPRMRGDILHCSAKSIHHLGPSIRTLAKLRSRFLLPAGAGGVHIVLFSPIRADHSRLEPDGQFFARHGCHVCQHPD